MIDLNSYLTKLSKKLSVSPEEKIKIDKSIGFLTAKLWEHFQDRLLKVEVFGSYDRGTALSPSVDPNSDVDLMVIFKTNEYQPATFLKHLNEFADKKYSRSEVSPDHPAITVILEHVKFELVPAYWETYVLASDDLHIPAPRNKEVKWIVTDPAQFKKDLEYKNSRENNMITPMVQIIKYYNTLKGKPYDSFIIENFAVSRSYPCKDLKDYFFEFINDLRVDKAESDEQRNFISELKSRRENLMLLEKRNLNDYIEQELQKFIPIPE